MTLLCSCAADNEFAEPSNINELPNESRMITDSVQSSESRCVSADKTYTKMQVLQMYKQAVDLVKLRCPGFTRTTRNELQDVSADGAASDALNAYIALLSYKKPGSVTEQIVSMDDDLACRIYFPIYNSDYGCEIYNGNSVRDALCDINNDILEIVLVLHEQTSRAGIAEEFLQIMTPYSQEMLVNNINNYFGGWDQ